MYYCDICEDGEAFWVDTFGCDVCGSGTGHEDTDPLPEDDREELSQHTLRCLTHLFGTK